MLNSPGGDYFVLLWEVCMGQVEVEPPNEVKLARRCEHVCSMALREINFVIVCCCGKCVW